MVNMKSRPLLAQVLAVNLLLVAGTVLVATIALDAQVSTVIRGRETLVLGLAIVATLLGNWLLLRRRFAPLDQLISAMERTDLAGPNPPALPRHRSDSAEVQRLEVAFGRMVSRLEAERRQAGKAAILRLQASIERAPHELRKELLETKRLSGQAMEELLALARQLRPAVLDDHGLIPALHSQVRDFTEQTGVRAKFNARGSLPRLTPEQQLVIYRVTQESLSNVVQHAGAKSVDVELSFIGRTVLRVSDDGCGFTGPRNGGLGLSGMRERAMLAGGHLSIWSDPGHGTRVELTIA
jgi:two-component system sensor histidine kinase UhpB